MARSLWELYRPRAKKEVEWWNANKVTKHPLPKGEKTDFEGQPVKTYDRKDMGGAKAGKDTSGETCEEVCEGKKENHNYPSTTDDAEEHDFRPHWVKRRKRQETA